MRAVVQRVNQASVHVGGREVSRIGFGFLVLLGVEQGDQAEDCTYLVDKIAGLRVFNDPAGKMNLALQDVEGEVLVVSQFTLLGDCRRGRRPSFVGAAAPEAGREWYECFASQLAEKGLTVRRGEFGADMDVTLVNQGPVTLLLDSRKRF
ncbi:MAG: D-tyrosyl-tRNA(Tyr) deacylase [Planctomycetales bacterium]|nr:D-tyrosyl-tRNA(Tyr) deacylase [Planctomycetales bacterium]